METAQTIHVAYDDRAIDSAFASVFGSAAANLIAPKTTKTYCGKRVAYEFAQTRKRADCDACIALHDAQKASDAKLLDEMIATWPAHVPLPDFLATRRSA